MQLAHELVRAVPLGVVRAVVDAGYFAPRLAQTVEGAVPGDLGRLRLTLSADLGAGMQRLARQEEPV
ncbi:MAG: hypothetical protein U0163_11765 [Gemmatimonadaceae bacterium]